MDSQGSSLLALPTSLSLSPALRRQLATSFTTRCQGKFPWGGGMTTPNHRSNRYLLGPICKGWSFLLHPLPHTSWGVFIFPRPQQDSPEPVGQFSVLQERKRVRRPSQYLPPFFGTGLVQSREENWTPPPQLREQSPHGPQGPQPPACGICGGTEGKGEGGKGTTTWT